MRAIRWTAMLALPFTLCVVADAAEGQGKGRGKGGEKRAQQLERQTGKQAQHQERNPERAAEKVTGRENARAQKGKERVAGGEVGREIARSARSGEGRGRFARVVTLKEVRPQVRRFVVSDRLREVVLGGAVAHAFVRGLPDDALVITPSDRVVLVSNRSGVVLLDLDDDRARNLGVWRVVALDGRVREGAPSFCRSGAGHPVWGRQWCLDKGFGLGSDARVRWGRTIDPGDLVFRETVEERLTREALRAVLGDVAFNRLAVHAITLGLVDPLTAVWLGEPSGPRVLLVSAGAEPVAEIVDVDRDNRVETIIVALRPW